MAKLDLSNGFFHINLHASALKNVGIKCNNTYYKFKKLPQGLATSPYTMQRVMKSVLDALLTNINVKHIVYLDDILLIGSHEEVQKGINQIMMSDLLVNVSKSNVQPVKKGMYLGVEIDLGRSQFRMTDEFKSKLISEIHSIKHKNITLRYKQRIAGLINFARTIIGFPLEWVRMAFSHPHQLYKIDNIFHSRYIPFYPKVRRDLVHTDATPYQIAIYNITKGKKIIFLRNSNILENEYDSILIAHAVFPNCIIFNDNLAAVYLFRKGRLPPSQRDSWRRTITLTKVYDRPFIYYVESAFNKADALSRAILVPCDK